jgi:hypothetical protein
MMGTTDSNAYGYLTGLCGTTATGYVATTGNWYEDDQLQQAQYAQAQFAQAYQAIWEPAPVVKKVVSFIQSLRDEVDNWLKLEVA